MRNLKSRLVSFAACTALTYNSLKISALIYLHSMYQRHRLSLKPFLVLLVSLTLCINVQASNIKTPDLIEASMGAAPACADWKVIGTCFWLYCDLLGCGVRTSVKVSHFLPDLVVTVQTEPAYQAWHEMRILLKDLQEQALSSSTKLFAEVPAGPGNTNSPSVLGATGNLRFLEADVFGHPQPTIPALPGVAHMCHAVTQSFKPYFQSVLDIPGWRSPEFDTLNLASWIPGRLEVGTWPLESWGSVYPRSGWIANVDLSMAAAVIAQRAAFIATGTDTLRPHFAVSHGSQTNRAPGRIDTNNGFKGKWQLVHPAVQDECRVFGTGGSPMGNQPREDHHLVWNLWRGYKCCPRAGQVFIEDVEF